MMASDIFGMLIQQVLNLLLDMPSSFPWMAEMDGSESGGNAPRERSVPAPAPRALPLAHRTRLLDLNKDHDPATRQSTNALVPAQDGIKVPVPSDKIDGTSNQRPRRKARDNISRVPAIVQKYKTLY